MKQQAEHKNLNLEQKIQKDISAYINKTEVERSIKNILQNAINYTKNGGIKITLKKENKKVILEIVDTGVGISEKDLPFIFDRFYKAEHSRNDESGSGLGLPIAKTLLERNSGKIDITSKKGVGTKVTIVLN
jgi:signal transduction histidine kinase